MFAERSGELSGVICLKNPLFYWVMTGNPLELLRIFFDAVRAIFWLCGSFLAPALCCIIVELDYAFKFIVI